MHLFYDITYFVFSNVQMSKPQTCRCQSHIAPASQRRNLSLCKCINSYHWFWLPAHLLTYIVCVTRMVSMNVTLPSKALLEMFT